MRQEGRRVLVTGVAGAIGARLAARLERDERIAHLTGLDFEEPRWPLERTEFVRADLQRPVAADLLRARGIDTLVHLAVTATPRHAGGRARMKERNVIGTMQVLAAAQRAPALRRVVMKSTTAVYGASPAAPSLLREDTELESQGLHGYARDAVDVEGYARGFGRRRADVALTVLRFANFIGPDVTSPLTAYLSLPVVPTLLGHDPRIQLLHADDAVEILARCVFGDHPGVYNVAGPGVVYLSQAIRLAGRPTVPLPAPVAGGLAGLARRAGALDFSPEQLQFLRYGRVADIGRMRAGFAYEPAFSTRAALADFVACGRIRPLLPEERFARWERALRERVQAAGADAARRRP